MVSVQRNRSSWPYRCKFSVLRRSISRLAVLLVMMLVAITAISWIRFHPNVNVLYGVPHLSTTSRVEIPSLSNEDPSSRLSSVAVEDVATGTTTKDSNNNNKRYRFLLQNVTLPERFRFLPNILLDYQSSSTGRLLDSDVVMLRHCHLDSHTFDWDLYIKWATHVLDQLLPGIQGNRQYQSFFTAQDHQYMEEEFILELLEIFSTQQGHCQFDDPDLFPGSPPITTGKEAEWKKSGETLRAVHTSGKKAPPDEARLTIVIVAFQDAEHLARIVRALHRPQHVFIIHLERRAPLAYVTQVQDIASQYGNVVVVQFGTVTYRTDSVSMINLQLIKWLVVDMKLQYDYHVLIGGAVYPLYGAQELARHLNEAKTEGQRHVWLGELTGGRNGETIRSGQYDYLIRMRFSYTRGILPETKLAFRIKQKLLTPYENEQSVVQIPPIIQEHMSFKTNSGNQAVYSYETMHKLLHTPDAMRVFAMAKYGCCCCLEERTWIAAMGMMGLRSESLKHGSMWQVWGGQEECGSSMNNAVLSSNERFCYRLEDMTEGVKRPQTQAWYIRGEQILGILKDAKERGFLFARKFHSSDSSSMELMEAIRQQLHTVHE